ncbi:MAG: hypothetical protein J6W52_10480 [Bacteroidaceae bacterium]|nr:hypothetical protein [Bacteroidaceae bacterium]
MKQKLLFFLFLLLTATTGWAQKVVLHKTDGQTVEYSVSELECITFEEEPPIVDGHEYVDLGLPSGTLWATCNVGASKPEETGYSLAWGETSGKSFFSWGYYKYSKPSATGMTKYCTNSSDGYNGFTDNLTELLPEDDAATTYWGAKWQMPSLDQIKELINNEYTTAEWTTVNDVNGYMITSKINGKRIFLPAAGYRYNSSFSSVGYDGYYWSRSLSGKCTTAFRLLFSSRYISYTNWDRYYGHSIRPVLKTN